MRTRLIPVLAVVAAVLSGALLVPAAYARLHHAPAPVWIEASPTPSPPTLAATPVDINLGPGNFFAWALLDRDTGTIAGSANRGETSTAESMIKVWIVSDYLRQLGDQQPPAHRLKEASAAIRDSDDLAAERLYRAAGGTDVIRRLIEMCGLTDTRISTRPGHEGWWSYTEMSPRDAVRMGDCIRSGKAAGPRWTDWVLDEMTKVRGTTAASDQPNGGRWGIVDGLPDEILARGRVGIKNGWTPQSYDGKWHVNCLAVADDWVLAVMMRYPYERGLDYGASVCEKVTEQLVTPRPTHARPDAAGDSPSGVEP
jgi:hypothetical protein